MYLQPKRRLGPLLSTNQYEDTKDPCPVFDGKLWHKFGSGGNVREEKWKILHATAPAPEGPWQECPTVPLAGLSGDHVAAPGIIFDGIFHMFIQTSYLGTGGNVEYLTSNDGESFERQCTVFTSLPGTDEAGIYDPHPAIIKGERYLVYSAMAEKRLADRTLIQPNVFLAKSRINSWGGPWDKLGKILDHADISWHHNQYDHPEYEWGIEGPQLVELPSGIILLNATSFLPQGVFGTRQRVFFTLAESVMGPYKTLGPVLDPLDDVWGNGENGHATGLILDDELFLFYQARPPFQEKPGNYWRYGLAVFDPQEIEKLYHSL